MAESRVDNVVSKITIRPSNPTPDHLKHYKISLLDQLAPPSYYIPIILFYSVSDHEFTRMSQKLRTSLSEVLSLYYPFCGRIKGNKSNTYVDCNDEGVLYLEARIPLKLSDFLKKNNKNPQPSEIQEFLPIDPYNPKPEEGDDDNPPLMAVQVSQFDCGSVGIGVCISHKVCDGTTVASFLQAWSGKAMEDGSEQASPPLNMEASVLFSSKDIEIDVRNGMIGEKNITTRRFLFSGNGLCRLREEISKGCSFKFTRVEAVTALIWKSAIEAAATADAAHQSCSSMAHAVNIPDVVTLAGEFLR